MTVRLLLLEFVSVMNDSIKFKVQLLEPRDNITLHEVNDLMSLICEKNVFNTKGLDILPLSARIVEKTVMELAI